MCKNSYVIVQTGDYTYKRQTIRLANSDKVALKIGLMLSTISDQTYLNDSKYALSVKVIKKPAKQNIDLLKFLNAYLVESFSFKHGTKND